MNRILKNKTLSITLIIGFVIIAGFLLGATNGFKVSVEASTSLPDLKVSNASVAGGSPVKAGTNVVFDFKVENVGKVNAPEHSITCYLNGEVFDSGMNGNALSPGEDDWSWCQKDNIGLSGNYTFKICVDDENSVAEENENNNCDEVSFSVESVPLNCPIKAKTDRIIVLFPEDGVRSDWDISYAQESPVKVNIPAGHYKITFVSYDNHSEKNQSQPHEQWFLKLFNKTGKKFLNTDSISDLPEDKDLFTEVVHQNLNISQNVSEMIPFHSFFPDTTSPNSVDPICASFDKIVQPPPPAPTCSLSANPKTINKGESSTLSWTTKNAISADLNQGIGTVALSGSKDVSPKDSTTYTLSVLGKDGSKIKCNTKVIVEDTPPPPAPACTLQANPTSIGKGGDSTLTWTTENAISASLNQNIGPVSLNGSKVVSPSVSTTYVLSVEGKDGSDVKCKTTIIVNDTPPLPSCTLSADPVAINKGESSTLSWTTENATSASIDQGIGSVALNGSQSVSPDQDTTYILTVKGEGDPTVTCSTSVTVKDTNPAPQCTLSASPSVIISGGSSTLSWTTKNVVSAVIDNGVGDINLPNGSTDVSPSSTTTYTLTATGSGDLTVNCQVTVTVSLTPLADVAITKDVSTNKVQKGGLFTYTLTYSNLGNLDAEDVTIDDTPNPTGVLTDFTIITDPGQGSCSVKTNGIECDLGTLTSGDSGSVVYKATGSKVGNVTNTAIINTSTSETDLSNNEDSEDIIVFIEDTPGCKVNCGGGLDPPTVVLFQKPGENFPFASQSFIYLSQIPYTGINGDFRSTIILLIIALLSIYISYLLIENNIFKRVLAFVFSSPSKSLSAERKDFYDEYKLYAPALPKNEISPSYEEEKEFLNDVVLPSSEIKETKFIPKELVNNTSLSPEERKIMSEVAKSNESLISDDALELIGIAAEIQKVRKEDLLVQLISSAKKSYPREDGYIIIDSNRAERILFSIETGLVQNFVNWLSEGHSKKSLDFVRLLRNNSISIESFIKKVVYYIDNLYRCQIGEVIDESHKIVDFESARYCWNKEELQEIVSILVNAVDESYKSQDASIKLALIKVIEITKKAVSRRSYYSN